MFADRIHPLLTAFRNRFKVSAPGRPDDDGIVWSPAPRAATPSLLERIGPLLRTCTKGAYAALRPYGVYAAAVVAIAALDVYALHRFALSLADAVPREAQTEFAAALTARTPPPDPAPKSETIAYLSSAAAHVEIAPPDLDAIPPPPQDDSAAAWSSGRANAYKTMCVRLCDGYFFPVSFAASRETFASDESICQSQCASPARLYAYRNPGESVSVMKNRDGEPYPALPTAFKFQTKYDPSCTCKPNAWEREAQDRHRMYALRDAKKKGKASKAERIELAALESATRASLRQSNAAYRVAGLGDRKVARPRRTAVASRKARKPAPSPSVRIAESRREPPGMMGLGASRKRYSWKGGAARSHGDLIHRQISGL